MPSRTVHLVVLLTVTFFLSAGGVVNSTVDIVGVHFGLGLPSWSMKLYEEERS